MHTPLKNKVVFLALAAMVLTASCKRDTDVLITNSEDALKPGSEVVNLILKTTMNDGSYDNILDGSSCFNIDLPVNIHVNNRRVSIATPQDLQIIERIFNESISDSDRIDFRFPITAIFGDFSEVIIENPSQLEEFVENCNNVGEDEDIECIDFMYPVTVSSFDRQEELLERITLSTDKELFNFIMNLPEPIIATINFPIDMMLSDGSKITVTNLRDLENNIQETMDDCDENDLVTNRFTTAITAEDLKVQKYKNNENNETKNYKDYVFTFLEDGTVKITKKENINDVVNGSWSVKTRIDGGLDVTFDFGTLEPLSKLNNQWNVKKIQDKRIMLDDRQVAGNSKDELFFIVD